MLRSTPLFALAFVLALSLAACATDAADESPGTEPSSVASVAPGGAAPSSPAAPATAAPPDSAPSQATGGGPATVTTGEAPPYGAVLTDGTGMTLYVFFEDSEGQSACYDACAENWPPLLTNGDAAAEGDADGELVGTVQRDDGATQATYDDQPLYRYAGDSEPGEVRGFGSGNVWYPVTPNGAAIDVTGSEPASGGEY